MLNKVGIFLVAALFFVSGCASSPPSTKELVMWLVGAEGQAHSINDLGQEFFKETGVKVRCEAISWGEAHSKYLTAVAGEVTPDIGTMGLTWGTEFGSLGAMVDLAQAYPADVAQIKSQAFPSIWAATEYKNKVFAIPFDMSMYVLYYRHDLVAKPPQTWDELTDILIKLHDQNKGLIFDWGSMSWVGYAPFLWQAGGDFYNQEGTRASLDTKEAALGLKYFSQLYTKYYVPKTKIPVEQGMRIGDFPLAISGNWKIEGLTLGAPEIEGKWSIALLPKGPTGERTAFIGGRVMGIFDQSKNKEEAWQFIKFLFKPENQVKLFLAAQATQDSYLPPNMDTWEALPMRAKFKKVLRAQALEAKGPPPVLGWDDSTRFIDQAIQKVILEGRDIEEELTLTTLEMNRQLKRKR